MTNPIPSKATRKRRAPKAWREVFSEATELECYAKYGFGYSHIFEIAAKKEGISISKEGIRVKLDRYKKSGYVNKINRGRFQIAHKGYYFFELL